MRSGKGSGGIKSAVAFLAIAASGGLGFNAGAGPVFTLQAESLSGKNKGNDYAKANQVVYKNSRRAGMLGRKSNPKRFSKPVVGHTVAQAKREAKKRQNVRARSSKRR